MFSRHNVKTYVAQAGLEFVILLLYSLEYLDLQAYTSRSSGKVFWCGLVHNKYGHSLSEISEIIVTWKWKRLLTSLESHL